MEDLDCRKWGNDSGGGSDTRDHIFLGTVPSGVELNHNTIFGRNASGATIRFEGRREFHAGDTRILNNIFPRTQLGNQAGVTGANFDEGTASLDNVACGGGKACTADFFNKNIIAGVDLRKYTTGINYNLCPTDARCTINFDFDHPQYGKLFDDLSAGVYRVREGHIAKRGGTDGKDIGADYDQLPQIRKLRIETTDRVGLFKYNVSEPIKQIPCVIEVSDKRDLSTIIPDLNASVFLRPGTDQQPDSIVSGVRRTLRIGKNVALSPSTVYWYRLHCGGDAAEGSFTTKTARTGSKPVALMVPASQVAGVASVTVEYGGGFDRATDSITGSTSTAPVPCSTGASCEVKFSVDAGSVSYYRMVYRDQNNNVIDSQPVDAASQPGVEVPANPKFTSSTSLNGASFIAGHVAPCQLVSFFGTDLGPPAPASAQLAPDGKSILKTLSDTRVLFDGEAAPLLFVSSTQINVVVPASVAQRRLTEVQIEYKEQLSDPVILPIGTARPGIFTAPLSTQAIVQHYPDNSLNSSTNPAQRGNVIIVFGTSGGATAPACQDASAIPLEARPLQLAVSATVGGIPTPVIYGGSTPGFPGLMQFNLQIPAEAPVGDAVPLGITVGDTTSQPGVTIAIR